MLFVGQSWYSLREGRIPVPLLVDRAARQGCTALAPGDRGGLYGAPAFVRACRRAGIKSILGCTLPLRGRPVSFLATTAAGYASLCRLVTRARVDGELTDPRPGVIALLSGPEQAALLQDACPCYLALDWHLPRAAAEALLATGLPAAAVATGDSPPDPATAARALAWHPQAVAAGAELVQRCADSWPLPAPRVPHFPGDLRALARAGLAARYGADAPYARLEQEIAVIEARGQAGYFLILWDLVRHAREQGISIGPGRVSAVGSLTAYAPGITDVDPLAHQLYFERFLNPERPDLPDIDPDVCSRRRPELLACLRRRHGLERVAQVGVIATLGPRGAVREAGRRLGTPPGVVARVASAFPATASTRRTPPPAPA